MSSLKIVWSLIFVLLSMLMTFTTPYKILFMPVNQKSHVFCTFAIGRALGQLGHESHFLFTDVYPVDSKMAAQANEANISFARYVRTRTNVTETTDKLIEEFATMMISNKASFSDMANMSSFWTPLLAMELLLENEPLVEKLNSAGFDMAVIDGTFATKQLYLLAHRLGIPWITYTDYPNSWVMRVPWLPSFVPSQFAHQTEKMNFIGRAWNAMLSIAIVLKEYTVLIPETIMNEYQKYGSFGSTEELAARSKFWLITSDPVIDYAKPSMPHMAEVGGLTTEPANNLPDDLQSFLDGAEDGVIVVSFGSMLSSYPDKLLRSFLEAFSRIKRHRIVWRLTNVSSEFHIPDFIRGVGWLPQNDILGHPKVKLFITHCGNNGQFEALYHGVPMIGFPFLGDQHYNALRLEYKGFGIAMNIHAFTSDELYSNILKIITDPSYKRRTSLASEIFRSAPQRPAERAAYWIEHVIKFGSDHLQSAGKDLNFFQFFMLDILALFLTIAAILAIIVVKFSFWMRGRCSKTGDRSKLKAA